MRSLWQDVLHRAFVGLILEVLTLVLVLGVAFASPIPSNEPSPPSTNAHSIEVTHSQVEVTHEVSATQVAVKITHSGPSSTPPDSEPPGDAPLIGVLFQEPSPSLPEVSAGNEGVDDVYVGEPEEPQATQEVTEALDSTSSTTPAAAVPLHNIKTDENTHGTLILEDSGESVPPEHHTAEESQANESRPEELVGEQPIPEIPIEEGSIKEEPVIIEPYVEEPVPDDSVVEVSAAEEPVVEDPTEREPSGEESAVEPTVINPVAEEPAVEDLPPEQELTAEEPKVEEDTAEEPAVEEPTLEESSVEEPTAEDPVAEESTVEEAKAEERSVEETSGEELPVPQELAAESPTSEEPQLEGPPAEDSPTEDPAVEEPTVVATGEELPGLAAEDLPAEEPPVEESAADKIVVEELPTGEDSEEQPAGNTAVGEPPAGDPTEEEPVVEKLPVVEETALEELPAAEEPPVEEPAGEETAVKESLAEDSPAEEDPTEKDPVAEEPIIHETVSEEGVVSKDPAAEEPVAEDPIAESPTPVSSMLDKVPVDVDVDEEALGDNSETSSPNVNETDEATVGLGDLEESEPSDNEENEVRIQNDEENESTEKRETSEGGQVSGKGEVEGESEGEDETKVTKEDDIEEEEENKIAVGSENTEPKIAGEGEGSDQSGSTVIGENKEEAGEGAGNQGSTEKKESDPVNTDYQAEEASRGSRQSRVYIKREESQRKPEPRSEVPVLQIMSMTSATPHSPPNEASEASSEVADVPADVPSETQNPEAGPRVDPAPVEATEDVVDAPNPAAPVLEEVDTEGEEVTAQRATSPAPALPQAPGEVSDVGNTYEEPNLEESGSEEEDKSITSPVPVDVKTENEQTPPEVVVGEEEEEEEEDEEDVPLDNGDYPSSSEDYKDPLLGGGGIFPDSSVTHREISRYEDDESLPSLVPSSGNVAGPLTPSQPDTDLSTGVSLRHDSPLPVAPAVVPPQHQGVISAADDSLSVGCIIGIVFGVLSSIAVLMGAAGFLFYQQQSSNRPKVLNSDRGYAGSDSGGYIDDQVRVSYVNSHLDMPKGSPEDTISLDNDSFLNSLESMTIQNLWTDNIRHTKL